MPWGLQSLRQLQSAQKLFEARVGSKGHECGRPRDLAHDRVPFVDQPVEPLKCLVYMPASCAGDGHVEGTLAELLSRTESREPRLPVPSAATRLVSQS